MKFEVLKHNSKTPHFDLKIQIGKETASWAIPRGPTLDNTVKRLAVTEEKYGDGPTEIFDEGEYIPEIEVSKGVRKEIPGEEGEEVMKEGLEKGEIKFNLLGKKLKGSFALVKTKNFPPGVKNAWLLIKHKDKYVKIGYDAWA